MPFKKNPASTPRYPGRRKPIGLSEEGMYMDRLHNPTHTYGRTLDYTRLRDERVRMANLRRKVSRAYARKGGV